MSALEEDTVDWDDVEVATGEMKKDPAANGGDDVISLGGAEELEEEVIDVSEPEVEAKREAATPAKKPETTALESVVSTPSKPLPPGWKLQTARSGGTYYFNVETGATTWDFPAEVSETAPAAEKKLGGIQIRGAARNGGSADRKLEEKEGEVSQSSKKREATSTSKGNDGEGDIAAQDIPQSEHTFRESFHLLYGTFDVTYKSSVACSAG
jgi:hypothetical protein